MSNSESVFRHYIVQLIKASDGTRTEAVALTLDQLLVHLEKVEVKDDYILVLHDVEVESFSLHPFMTIASFLKLHGVEI